MEYYFEMTKNRERNKKMQINIKRKIKNWMQLEISAISENEQLARIAVASFITPLNPTLEEMADVKTAVS